MWRTLQSKPMVLVPCFLLPVPVFDSSCCSFSAFRIMGLCLLQNEMCPLFLNRHVIKYILGRKINWHDLAFFDPVMFESLRQLMHEAETKETSPAFAALDLTFSIDLCPEEASGFERGQSFYIGSPSILGFPLHIRGFK